VRAPRFYEMRISLSKPVAQAFLPVLVFLLIIAALLPSAGCKQKRKWATPEPLSQQLFLASSISIGDPASSSQLLSGFYKVEDTWRWTRKDFSVMLGRPATAAEKGAKITLVFAIPDLVIQKFTSITLYAVANELKLPPETYTTPGDSTYSRDLPPASFTSEKVKLDFHLDKALPPSATDSRELGIIVSAVGFENK
jgi:hypothetical protein